MLNQFYAHMARYTSLENLENRYYSIFLKSYLQFLCLGDYAYKFLSLNSLESYVWWLNWLREKGQI